MATKKTIVEKLPAQENAEASPFPLFFNHPHVITLDRHASARIKPGITLEFAAGTNSIPLTLGELPEAAKHYPIVFTGVHPVMPAAIVGLEKGNYFVNEDGSWMEGKYIPAYVRKYPFIFTELTDSDQLALCIDEDALTLDGKGKDGIALYEDGKASAAINNAMEFCKAHHQQHVFTRQFCDLLAQKGFLSSKQSDITLASGRKAQLTGFQQIDVEKITTLSDTEITDWFKRGYLAALFYIIQSNSNWNFLLNIANRQEPAEGGKTEKPKKGLW